MDRPRCPVSVWQKTPGRPERGEEVRMECNLGPLFYLLHLSTSQHHFPVFRNHLKDRFYRLFVALGYQTNQPPHQNQPEPEPNLPKNGEFPVAPDTPLFACVNNAPRLLIRRIARCVARIVGSWFCFPSDRAAQSLIFCILHPSASC